MSVHSPDVVFGYLFAGHLSVVQGRLKGSGTGDSKGRDVSEVLQMRPPSISEVFPLNKRQTSTLQ